VDSTIIKNILQTTIYYDILDFPLTSFEIWKYLLAESGCILGDVVEALENNELKNHIEEFRGFYFLKGRRDLVGQRIQNDKNSIAKFKTAERVAWWLRFLPFVRMVAVTGTLAMKNCEKDSDIDFLVVLERGKIWTGRLLVTLCVHLLGRRRYDKKIKNRICLNYFITTGSLEIKKKDLFAANEYSFIYPLFDSKVVIPSEALAKSRNLGEVRLHEDPSTVLGMTKNSVFCQFGKANIGWIEKYKPNFEYGDLKPAKYSVEIKSLQQGTQRFFEGLINLFWGDRIELWLKRKQIKRIKNNPLTYKKGGYVEYTDENLIFLPEPQGGRIEEEWQRKLEVLKV
jgi:hypothetical protein